MKCLQPLSKLGAKVTGLDAGSENIEAAKYHASLNTSFGKEQLTYINDSIENFLTAEGHKNVHKFDGVILSEIVEHVLDVENFLNASCSLVKVCKMWNFCLLLQILIFLHLLD